MTAADHPDLMNYREAATFLGVPVGTLYAMVSQKTVPHVRLGVRLVRFSRRALESWIAARAVACVSPFSSRMR